VIKLVLLFYDKLLKRLKIAQVGVFSNRGVTHMSEGPGHKNERKRSLRDTFR
jgi:hypothetical protein